LLSDIPASSTFHALSAGVCARAAPDAASRVNISVAIKHFLVIGLLGSTPSVTLQRPSSTRKREPELVQKLLGHSNLSTTADVYTHTSANRSAALALEQAIFGDLFQVVPSFGTWNKNAAAN